jgi:queuine tRNA-ribosyltransferase
MPLFSFTLLKESKKSGARAGILHTPHGDIHTPAFLPVATQGTVKGLTKENLENAKVQACIANTYHLHLSPGSKRIQEAGGLHSFMKWDKPLLTDSGGFQVFSLGAAFGGSVSKIKKEEYNTKEHSPQIYDEKVSTDHGKLALIDEEGVSFTSHRDGSFHRFTPERSVEIQHELGADIFFAFDECTGGDAPYEYQKEAMERTHRWAERSLLSHRQNISAQEKQMLFGIVQGGRFEDLRKESASFLSSLSFDGFGIGGSYEKKDIDTAVGWATLFLPKEKPRHLLGIGEVEDMEGAIKKGIDTFDCVSPTRNTRTGTAYFSGREKISLTKSMYRNDDGVLDSSCACSVCQTGYTRAYLSHLFHSKEMLGPVLLSIHNISVLTSFVEKEREKILNGEI